MRTTGIIRCWVGILFLGLMLNGCASPTRDTPAVLVKSAQFEIFSTMSAEKTKALALELERFHALIYSITNAPRVPPVVPTRIFAFDRKYEYLKFGPRGSAGVFIPMMRENRILLADYSSRLSASEIILHEYVHFVLRNAATTNYPIWYDEGFAEFLSTAKTYGEDRIALGAFPKARLSAFQYLEWVPLRRIIAAGSYDDLKGRDAGMLYPESWALVHYLFLDREAGTRPITEEITDYLAQVKSGVVPHVAFKSAFGETTDSASRNIQKILERRKLRVISIPIASLDYDSSEPSVRKLTTGEVAFQLGELSLQIGKHEAAEEKYRAAIDGNPNNARAFVGLGDALKYQNRYDEAQKAFERALEIDSDNALNHLDHGEYLAHVAGRTEYGEERTALLVKAREAYKRSWELDDSIPETLAVHGRTYLAAGENPARGYTMMLEALTMMPANGTLLNWMAEAAFAADRKSEARKWLAKLYATRTGGGGEKMIAKQMKEFEEAREKQEAIAQGGDPDA